MSAIVRAALLGCGFITAAGAVLHLAIMLGGPQWYAFFGAPTGLVEMARAGHPRAALSCIAIAAVLSVWSAYALSGAAVIGRLPLLRTVLGLIAAVLLLRGLLFVPLIYWNPEALLRICDCRQVDTFIVLTSLLCLLLGSGYALGAACGAVRRA